MSSRFKRENAVISFAPAADYSEKKGYLVDLAGDDATISASAAVPAKGVILDGGIDADSEVSVGILGTINGTVLMKSGGVIAKGAAVIQGADGRILTDSGAGARVKVGVALEAAVENDLIEVAPITPQVLA